MNEYQPHGVRLRTGPRLTARPVRTARLADDAFPMTEMVGVLPGSGLGAACAGRERAHPKPDRSRASRATRRASWRGTGVRAASVEASSTAAAAVSGLVRQAAWARTGRAPVRVQTQYPTM